MNKLALTVIASALALSTMTGCATLYTNIEKTGDNTYLVTRIKQGFFNVSGSLFACTASSETKMTCKEVGTP